MLRFSLNLDEAADKIEAAVQQTLSEGFRTPDIYSDGMKKVTTSEMGELIAERV